MKSLTDRLRMAHAFWVILSCNVRLFMNLYWIKQQHIYRGTHGTPEYRDAFTRMQTWYGAELLERLCRALAVAVTFDHPGIEWAQLVGRPLILESNHQSSIDIPIVYALCARLGLTRIYWVMKRDLEHTPYGWAVRETCGAIVDRDGGQSDLPRICRCATVAEADGAVLAIYPEGTRFTLKRRGPRYKELMDPKTGGFCEACRTMLTARILSVTLRWSGGPEGLGIRTLTDMRGLIGRTHYVGAKLVERDAFEADPRTWLKEVAWPEKDALLAALRAAEKKGAV